VSNEAIKDLLWNENVSVHMTGAGINDTLEQAYQRGLAANAWTPITPDNLPKVGDEVLWIYVENDVQVDDVRWDWTSADVRGVADKTRAYRRPVNPPLPEPPKEGE
jgi:hypothetical protein